MEVLDGFIVGVYNYCDRWCETCRFSSHCRVFADRAEMEAGFDLNLKALVDAPPIPPDIPPPPPRWLQECIDEMNEAARNLTDEDVAEAELLRRVAAEHEPIEQRARAYSRGTAGWLQTVERPDERDHADPRAVLWHFCAMIPVKVHRALCGLQQWNADPDDWPSDHDGSAKVALLAIDRSRAAWISAAEWGLASAFAVEPFVTELGILADELERVLPKARAFVRPGFDEPEALAEIGLGPDRADP